jgi:hypothetical protein
METFRRDSTVRGTYKLVNNGHFEVNLDAEFNKTDDDD